MDAIFYGFDMSSAIPWMLMGALAAALLIFLLQAIIGTKRRLRREIAALQTSLAGERNTVSEAQVRIRQLEDDSRNYQTALADASKRAAQATDAIKTHEATISALKRDIDSRYIQIKGFEEELTRHAGENTALKRAYAGTADQIARLKAEAEHGAQAKTDAGKLRSDLAQALANFAALRTEYDQRIQIHTAKADQFATLQLEHDRASKSAATATEELQRVKSELARVTAELDAATRLAAEHANTAQRLQSQVAQSAANDGETAKLHAEIQRLLGERDAKAELASHHIEHGQRLQTQIARHAADADMTARLVSAREAEIESLRSEITRLKTAVPAAAAAAGASASQSEEIQRLKLVITNLQSEIEAKSRHAAAALASAAAAPAAAQAALNGTAQAAPVVKPDINATLAPRPAAPSAGTSSGYVMAEPPRPLEAAGRADLNHLRSVKSEALRTAAKDDLKLIQGIGPLLETRLNSIGVTSYAQIANWTAAEVDRIGASFDIAGRIHRENWIEQAKILASGGHTHFSRQFTHPNE